MQVRVPASSANLGPGFDGLGLALGVYLTCRFQRAEKIIDPRERPRCRADFDRRGQSDLADRTGRRERRRR